MDSVTLAKMGISIIDVESYKSYYGLTSSNANKEEKDGLMKSSSSIFGSTIGITTDAFEETDLAVEEL